MMNNQQLWQQLQSKGLTTQSAYPETTETTIEVLWYVRLLQGIGGWFAALFLIGGVAFMVAPIFDKPIIFGLLGLVMSFSAYHYFRQQQANRAQEFLSQLFLAVSIAGQGLVSFALAETLGWRHETLFLILAVYQLLLVVLMRDFVHRLLSTLFAVILLIWGQPVLLVSGLGGAFICLLLVWLWMGQVHRQPWSDFYEPVAYALAIALVGLNVQALNWLFKIGSWRRQIDSDWLLLYGPWISLILQVVAFLYLFYKLWQGRQFTAIRNQPLLVIGSLLVIGLFSVYVYGFSSAVLLLLLGFARCNRPLMVLAVVAMLGFISWYYYQLDVTLLIKSLTLLAMGGFMLLVVFLTRSNAGHSLSENSFSHQSGMVLTVTLVTVLVALLVVNFGIYQKQRILKHGDLLLLSLAPVDPRSLMQGDFMRLRFALSDDIGNALKGTDSDKQINQVVVEVDENQVAEFIELYRGQDLADNEYRLNFREKRRGVGLTTDAYFFEEGSAAIFERASFGGFRVNNEGEALLVGLYDTDYQLLSSSIKSPEN